MSRVEHAPGAFCWVEMITTHREGAADFYGKLFGWTTHDDEIPGGGVYTMLRLGDGNVGGLYEQPAEMKALSVPPAWLPYVTVENAATACARAEELGGSVVKDTFDVMEIGSMAVLCDPTGAAFAVWQPKTHTGADFGDGRPGSVCWNELATNDSKKASAFYEGMFGWNASVMEMGSGPYTMFGNGEAQAAGMLQMTDEWKGAPSHWLVYFAVSDCDSTVIEAEGLGGSLRVEPRDIPGMGRFAILADPQGGGFAIFQREG